MTSRLKKINTCAGCDFLSGDFCGAANGVMTPEEMLYTPRWCPFPKIIEIVEGSKCNIILIEKGKRIG